MNRQAAIRNTRQLVESGVLALKQAGWTEARIVLQLPHLASEAVAFLARKRAAA